MTTFFDQSGELENMGSLSSLGICGANACVHDSPNTIKLKHLQRHWRTVHLSSREDGYNSVSKSHNSSTCLTAGWTVSNYNHQLGQLHIYSRCCLKIHYCPQWLNTRTISFLCFQIYPTIKFLYFCNTHVVLFLLTLVANWQWTILRAGANVGQNFWKRNSLWALVTFELWIFFIDLFVFYKLS